LSLIGSERLEPLLGQRCKFTLFAAPNQSDGGSVKGLVWQDQTRALFVGEAVLCES
jgi:hypothetical protein